MIRLVDYHEEPDAEEEHLRAMVLAQQRDARKLAAEAAERERKDQHEAGRLSNQAAEDSEVERERGKRVAQGQHTAQLQYRVAEAAGRCASAPGAQYVPGDLSNRKTTPVWRKGQKKASSLVGENSEFANIDEFRPMLGQQPAMFDTMKLAPGVSMVECGRAKSTPQTQTKQMSRKEFLNFQAISLQSSPDDSRATTAPGGSHDYSATEELVQDSSMSFAPIAADEQMSMTSLPDERLGTPLQLPSSRHRTYRHTHSLSRSFRERQPTLGMHDVGLHSTLSFRRGLRPAAAQPRLGATMGHGLLSNSGREGSVPGSRGERMPSDRERSHSQRSSMSDPSGSSGGKITANHDLLRHLFKCAT